MISIQNGAVQNVQERGIEEQENIEQQRSCKKLGQMTGLLVRFQRRDFVWRG